MSEKARTLGWTEVVNDNPSFNPKIKGRVNNFRFKNRFFSLENVCYYFNKCCNKKGDFFEKLAAKF
ncbi:hypothetical protein JOD43_003069 [Pullulanibacillus pueri]|uniref:Uncharacterized protein n=1 Tax=Pullulanibacillus pueri TaxID=1437324 RepID=A0A8J2ZX17_9BACL|nr:hypothetical protein [Pullulanibacillus pueri]GGH84401.1 hypothetical protein GCM10007096_27390 [Pullulanibacillus pueri]